MPSLRHRLSASLSVVVLALASAHAAGLTPRTTAAFERYAALTEQRQNRELGTGQPFLWIDTLSADRQAEMRRGLRGGGVIVESLETRDGGQAIDVPDALIHHWGGLVFVPDVKVDTAIALMHDYDRHSQIFSPNIVSSRTLEHSGDRFRVALRFHVKKVISVTLDTENEAQFFHPQPDRGYSRIRSTRVSEIADAGTPEERAKAPGTEQGFMWRLNTYWRFLERDGGTYVQCESLTLSRDVPFALGWIIRPFVTQVPKESLSFTLGRIRSTLMTRG